MQPDKKHVVGANSVRPWAFGQCAAMARRWMQRKINGRTICVTIVNIVQVVHFVHFVIVVIIIILFKVTYYSYNLYEVHDMYDYYDYDTYYILGHLHLCQLRFILQSISLEMMFCARVAPFDAIILNPIKFQQLTFKIL